MPRKGGQWIVWLRANRQPLPADISALFDDPSPLVRVNAAGAWWGRTGEAKRAADVVGAAIRTGDRDAIIFGCQVLAAMGPAAGNIVSLVWEYLVHNDGAIRLNAASAIAQCCTDKRVLVEVRARLVPDTGDGLYDACIRLSLRRMERAIVGEGDARPGGKPKLEQSRFS
jgi:hypothetical protein